MHEPVSISVRSTRRIQTLGITAQVRDAVTRSGVREGICVVFVPHTTAGLTLNENADPDVVVDVEGALSRLAPVSAPYRHAEGNSDSHVKTSLVGSSLTLIVHRGALVLGGWQGIHFCEFDGPRSRTVHVKCVEG
jgi:secondary thiamine-phosphate synthase enzyme